MQLVKAQSLYPPDFPITGKLRYSFISNHFRLPTLETASMNGK